MSIASDGHRAPFRHSAGLVVDDPNALGVESFDQALNAPGTFRSSSGRLTASRQ